MTVSIHLATKTNNHGNTDYHLAIPYKSIPTDYKKNFVSKAAIVFHKLPHGMNSTLINASIYARFTS